jgi:hypothetical protein
MDIQAEINWIQTELQKVRDPEIILAFKNMLKYRQKKESVVALDEALERALADKEAGRTTPHSEIKKKYEKWL